MFRTKQNRFVSCECCIDKYVVNFKMEKWSRNETLALIAGYEGRPELWDERNPCKCTIRLLIIYLDRDRHFIILVSSKVNTSNNYLCF